MYTNDEKLKAAYALNLCSVSVSQIIDYNDINVLEQEYESILYNLNLEQMPKDSALLDIIKDILDVITFFRISEEDKKHIALEYQHKMKNAVYSAIPKMSMLFASVVSGKPKPIAMAVALASTIGTGYMNYRRNRSQYQSEKGKEYWRLKRNTIEQLNGLQKCLFETAWELAKKYEFPDEYRLTDQQIHRYNEILMIDDPIKRYNMLESMKKDFSAYPHFWYQMGSTANSIYCSCGTYDESIKQNFRKCAVECFEYYRKINKLNVLRCDIITSSWALEYIDLLDLSNEEEREKAKELAAIAEKHAGYTNDVLELCAYAYLKLDDKENAARILNILVSSDYNIEVNARILSGLYIQKAYTGSDAESIKARESYLLLTKAVEKQYILSMPLSKEDFINWYPEWSNTEQKSETASEEIDVSRYEQIYIDNILHIAKDEVQKYKNKVIHFNAPINCEGSLEFDSCVLHYNELQQSGEIHMTDTASLSMFNCVIENHSCDKTVFINAYDVKQILNFRQCEFRNCAYFVETANGLEMSGCKIINAGRGFIASRGDDKISISECEFLFNDIPSFYYTQNSFYSDIICYSKLDFINNTVTASEAAASSDESFLVKIELLDIYWMEIASM